MDSRQVAYRPVYELLSPLLGNPDIIPGTPVWCQLDDTDPAKWQAVLWAAVWWAVNQDLHQEATADAATEIAAANDWSTQANRLRGRSGSAYIPRKAS